MIYCRRFITRRWYSVEKSLKTIEEKGGRFSRPPCSSGEGRGMSVTLLGVDSQAGHAAALCIKADGEGVSELRLWDDSGSLRGLGQDLSHIPTSPRVSVFVGEGQLEQALRRADVAVVLRGGWESGSPSDNYYDRFYETAEAVRSIASAVAVTAPKSLLAIASQPLLALVAFFGETLMSLGAFCPNRLLGLLCLEEMRACSLTSRWLCLPPAVVPVRLIGGSTPSTLVPVLGSAPAGQFLEEESLVLTRQIRSLTDDIKRESGGVSGPDLAAGRAVANFVRAAIRGLRGEERPIMSGIVRTDTLPGIRYFGLPVTIGPAGIEGIPTLPKLTQREFKLLVKSLPRLSEEIALGEAWAHSKRQQALSIRCD